MLNVSCLTDETDKASRHTPGPWRPDDDFVFIFGPQNEMIAEMRGDGADLPISSNAHLIAAAPEMLQALEAFIDGNGDRSLLNHAFALAEAAIRKARGER